MLFDIILDTDLGVDCDDVLALAELCVLHNSGECRLIGVSCSAPFEYAPKAVLSILSQYGLEKIPVSEMKNPRADYYSEGKDIYARAVYEAFPCTDTIFPNNLTLLRTLLANACSPVKLVVIGTMTNIAQLMRSEADELSPLDGISLMREKVSELVCMAGDFSHIGSDVLPSIEWNVKLDIEAVQYVTENSPCSITFLPFEAGMNVISGAKMVSRDGRTTPVGTAYITHGSSEGRSSWDPLTAYYAVRGCYGILKRSASGEIICREDGVTDFIPCDDGNHSFLMAAADNEKLAQAIDQLV